MKALKYILIELAEDMTITLQHLLAKEKGVAVHGYIDTIAKGFEAGILSEDTFNRLRPFFDFRNSMVHRYWQVDDTLLIQNVLEGQNDFRRFVEEIERHVKNI